MPVSTASSWCIVTPQLLGLAQSYTRALVWSPTSAGCSLLAAYERELIGLVQAVRHWWPYLWRRHFLVRLDHYSLKFLLDQRLSTVPQHQWISKLFGFGFDVEYQPKRLNTVAKLCPAVTAVLMTCLRRQQALPSPSSALHLPSLMTSAAPRCQTPNYWHAACRRVTWPPPGALGAVCSSKALAYLCPLTAISSTRSASWPTRLGTSVSRRLCIASTPTSTSQAIVHWFRTRCVLVPPS